MPRQLVLASKQSGARLAEGWLEKMARRGKKRWSMQLHFQLRPGKGWPDFASCFAVVAVYV